MLEETGGCGQGEIKNFLFTKSGTPLLSRVPAMCGAVSCLPVSPCPPPRVHHDCTSEEMPRVPEAVHVTTSPTSPSFPGSEPSLSTPCEKKEVFLFGFCPCTPTQPATATRSPASLCTARLPTHSYQRRPIPMRTGRTPVAQPGTPGHPQRE